MYRSLVTVLKSEVNFLLERVREKCPLSILTSVCIKRANVGVYMSIPWGQKLSIKSGFRKLGFLPLFLFCVILQSVYFTDALRFNLSNSRQPFQVLTIRVLFTLSRFFCLFFFFFFCFFFFFSFKPLLSYNGKSR